MEAQMLAAYPYNTLSASKTAGIQKPAGTINAPFINWPTQPGQQQPANQWPFVNSPMPGQPGISQQGGYISPTVNQPPLAGQQAGKPGRSLVSPVAGTQKPAGTITSGTINPELLRKLLGLGANGQGQPPMPDWLSSLGLGNFYTPSSGAGGQDSPLNSTIGGYAPPAPPPTRPIRRPGP